MLSEASKLPFIRYVTGELPKAELEAWVYAAPMLESELGKDEYLALASSDFQSREGEWDLRAYIYAHILAPEDLREYEEQGLMMRLETFIAGNDDLKEELDDFYALFCGHLYLHAPHWEPARYTFLQLIGLRYLYWMDEAYLRQQHGERWQEVYAAGLQESPALRAELRPIAQRILHALHTKEIEILDGQRHYRIAEELKNQLEPTTIIQP